MNHFKGKVAFVTGATSGIGRATAIAFGKNGATVVVTGRREKEGRETLDMVRTAGGDGTFMRLDVAVESEVAGVIREIVSRHGRLDCAVNCAGYDVAHALTEFSEADYDAIFNANVKGLFFCLKHEILAMRGKGGAIVNVGSVAAQMSDLGNSLYNASKAAAHSLNRTAATEAAKNGIRVNEVAPGPTKTPMLGRIPPRRRGCRLRVQFRIDRGEHPARPHWNTRRARQCGVVSLFRRGVVHYRRLPHRGWRLPARLGRAPDRPATRQRPPPLAASGGCSYRKARIEPLHPEVAAKRPSKDAPPGTVTLRGSLARTSG